MTAQVLSLDGARVSARRAVPFEHATHATLVKVLDRLRRQVAPEAESMFQSARRSSTVYITYEEVVDAPELDPVA